MGQRIAIIGLACEYPDASSPAQLWENVLAQRRAFRRLPDERLSRADYYWPDPDAGDRFYTDMAAVIEGYEFDRVGFRVGGSTYRSTDLTHWLALDVASRALADAGFPGGAGLPALTTGVIVGNTLTGEFSRANLMRLRWPYVRRTVAAALRAEGFDDRRLEGFLAGLERQYKAPFPQVGEDTLAGGLSNTIAGRISNHFDLRGGAYTVDGACSSSLLAVVTACTALADHEIDVAIVGGVDLSIDPFELIGFAKVGALTPGEMRVFDRRSSGFLPGEGAAMAVLVREEDATGGYAVIEGWGRSSDGRGGITRPTVDGYRLAMRRAYERAGFGPDTVGYFEGHSTGTPTGDQVELEAISAERDAADPQAPPAPIGSIKALIGHTKAACGIASLIKATLAVRDGIIPPTAGCVDPHDVLLRDRPALRASAGEPWPSGRPRRAGVTSMGFGGINTHVVIGQSRDRRTDEARSVALLSSAQDRELLLADADEPAELRETLLRLADSVSALSFAELGDLAAVLHDGYRGRPLRAAIVAGHPVRAAEALRRAADALGEGSESLFDPDAGVFLGRVTGPVKAGLLFPGQGSIRGSRHGHSAARGRFRAVLDSWPLPDGDPVDTAVAQPRIVAASLAAVRVLSALGIEAEVAVGHSVGELAALAWAGAVDEAAALRIATVRGRIMAGLGSGGAMAGLAAAPDRVTPLLAGDPVVIAALNGPGQTVVSGPADAVDRVAVRARQAGIECTRLRVSHAFHSPLVAPAAAPLAEHVRDQEFRPLRGRVISTVTGQELAPGTDLVRLLTEQVTAPVRFGPAVAAAAHDVGLFIEAGSGSTLSGLAAGNAGVPALSMDLDAPSLAPLLQVVAAAVVLGVPVRTEALWNGRFTRPFRLGAPLRFFANPCESTPDLDLPAAPVVPRDRGEAEPRNGASGDEAGATEDSAIERLRRLTAERAELPLEVVRPDTKPLDDLHLSSIVVGQIMNEAAAERGLTTLAPATGFATASLAELAEALDDLAAAASPGQDARRDAVEGAGPWVRPFAVAWVPADPLPPRADAAAGTGSWQAFVSPGGPEAEPLRRALETAGIGDGVLICPSPAHDTAETGTLLAGARAALAGARRCLVVQSGGGAAALAKTLHLENPEVVTCVVNVPAGPFPVAAVVREAAAATGFTEVRLDERGRRSVPVLRPHTSRPGPLPLGPEDVVLVTGGGKGITAECARELAIGTGAKLAILGRSDPARDAALAANLARLEAAGVEHAYFPADVTSEEQVAAAVAGARERLGEVTAVLHGAGRNRPAALTNADETSFRATVAPKVDGLRAVLRAVGHDRLRLLVTFGSIIGRTGLRGQAEYGTANEWLTDLTLDQARRHPDCRCLAIEWSVWSGVGMGEHLGVLDALVRDGIRPIPPDEGVRMLLRLIADPGAPGVTVVVGRAGDLPTVSFEERELPLARFTENPLVFYPSIELVAEARLTGHDDPYLADHQVDGVAILPGVLALEAMTEAAAAVTALPNRPAWENVEFLRPVTADGDLAATIRIGAVVREDGDSVDVVIRSAETDFAAEHVRGTFRPGPVPPAGDAPTHPAARLIKAVDWYGPLYFQGSRFQRVIGYRSLTATGCVAEISGSPDKPWFGPMLPARLLLADPGPRDAFMHAIQACVPDATLLPDRVERLVPATGLWPDRIFLDARERSHDGDSYLYDLTVYDEAGRVVEEWQGLRLRALRRHGPPAIAALIGPYLQRRLPEGVGVAVEPEGHDERAEATRRAVSRAVGADVFVRHRPDGRPEIELQVGSGHGPEISASHGPGFVLAVAGNGPLGCDAEEAVDRPWPQLLKAGRITLAERAAAELGEPLAVAATRVWAATECQVKAGGSPTDPLSLIGSTEPGSLTFASGRARIVTIATALSGTEPPVVFAVLTGDEGRA
ncbi:polyketide synthase family protein [Actinoallomurus rhizosphaericola]|uniref:polyketide synthase family protein n=1 Tax=Actinoallomurus rhizosphaericola TaxID=2952536 RepID=UPI0020924CBD|nr:type I polyketide synthase [Actinoallomurus rhizosphaericola]MCO5998076.1 type I polyketide synthase [Actinoallomurus rhizosphaericola]